ncbi:hypothetical protein HAX54_028248 [Datura stramonium]|uniref:Uncharacterized protein n=1 Tax=Datura stramonium TaxID=4076 RepID=A0ABS8V4M1_DATST|nr:hypothetical protein [Datura stramonium]
MELHDASAKLQMERHNAASLRPQIDETSVIEVDIAQAYLCYGLQPAGINSAWIAARHHDHGAMGSARCRASRGQPSQIPVRLGTEAAKLNSNPTRNNEDLIYYYIYPCLVCLRHPSPISVTSVKFAQFIPYEFV